MGQKQRRIMFLLVDGLGDVSVSALGGYTPLQAAKTPHLDALAAGGLNGLMDPVEPGLACGSDTAHLSILGYEPRRCYRGRGAFESLGAGIPMSPGDIAFKSNFATMDLETGIVEKRRADRNFEEAGPVLCDALNGLTLPSYPDLEVRVRYATEHRCGVVLHGPGLSDAVSGTDPLKDGLPLCHTKALDGTIEASRSAAAVQELSAEMSKVLVEHPINAERRERGVSVANVVLLRGCGSLSDLPKFEELHGLKSCVVAPTKIIAGLALSLGMDLLPSEGGTGAYDTALHNKARVICGALAGEYTFGFLHVKAVDDAGHDRNMPLKVAFLESVDMMFGHVLKLLWESNQESGHDFTLVCTGDHTTPVVFGDHSYEPVPLSMGNLNDVVTAFGGGKKLDDVQLNEIKNPDTRNLPILNELRQQAEHQVQLHAVDKPGLQFDEVQSFDEISTAKGALGRFCGSELMSLIKDFSSS